MRVDPCFGKFVQQGKACKERFIIMNEQLEPSPLFMRLGLGFGLRGLCLKSMERARIRMKDEGKSKIWRC